MGFYRSVPITIEAVQYTGTNLTEVKEMLARQYPPGRITVAGTSVTFLRRQDRPDEPLVTGDWITLDSENWVTIMTDSAFQRRMQPL